MLIIILQCFCLHINSVSACVLTVFLPRWFMVKLDYLPWLWCLSWGILCYIWRWNNISRGKFQCWHGPAFVKIIELHDLAALLSLDVPTLLLVFLFILMMGMCQNSSSIQSFVIIRISEMGNSNIVSPADKLGAIIDRYQDQRRISPKLPAWSRPILLSAWQDLLLLSVLPYIILAFCKPTFYKQRRSHSHGKPYKRIETEVVMKYL